METKQMDSNPRSKLDAALRIQSWPAGSKLFAKNRRRTVLTVCKSLALAHAPIGAPRGEVRPAGEAKCEAKCEAKSLVALAHVLVNFRMDESGIAAMEFLCDARSKRLLKHLIKMAFAISPVANKEDVTTTKAAQLIVASVCNSNPRMMLVDMDIASYIETYLVANSCLSKTDKDVRRTAATVLCLVRGAVMYQLVSRIDCLLPIVCRLYTNQDSDYCTALIWAATLQSVLTFEKHRLEILNSVKKRMQQDVEMFVAKDPRVQDWNQRIRPTIVCLQGLFSPTKFEQHDDDVVPCIADWFWTVPFFNLAIYANLKDGDHVPLEMVLFMLADLALVARRRTRLAAGLCHLLPRVQDVLRSDIAAKYNDDDESTSLRMACLWFVGSLANTCSLEWSLVARSFLMADHGLVLKEFAKLLPAPSKLNNSVTTERTEAVRSLFLWTLEPLLSLTRLTALRWGKTAASGFAHAPSGAPLGKTAAYGRSL